MSNYGGQYEQKPDQQYGAAPGQYYQPTADDKTWAMLAHISPIVGLGFIGPLIVWLIYKDKSPFVADQAKEALNFSLAVLITVLVLCATCIGNKGVWYRYPYTFRMIN